MSYFDTYKLRLSANGGSIANSIKNSTLQLIDNSFEDSPFYQIVDINGINVGCRVESTDEENKRKLLFKFDNTNQTGDIVTLDNEKWLITDYVNNGVIARGKIHKSNHILKFYLTDGTTLISTPAIVTNKSFTIEEEKFLILPDGKLEILIQNNANNLTINTDKRFIIDDNAWKVVFIDKITYPNIIKLTVESDQKINNDDLTNDIANNSTSDSDEGGGIF